jgi:predicted negative regulator of RcsB-dependent stress response
MSNTALDNSLQSKIINFCKKNTKIFVICFFSLILILLSYLFYKDLQKKNETKLSEHYTYAVIQFKEKKNNAKQLLEDIVNKDHRFYSPLALYFIIDNNLETDNLKIINFFNKILSISSIDDENLNLIKIKKAIFLFNLKDEEQILKTLNPIINSDSVWKNTAIQLISDYYLSTEQKIKANEYIQLLNNKNKK